MWKIVEIDYNENTRYEELGFESRDEAIQRMCEIIDAGWRVYAKNSDLRWNAFFREGRENRLFARIEVVKSDEILHVPDDSTNAEEVMKYWYDPPTPDDLEPEYNPATQDLADDEGGMPDDLPHPASDIEPTYNPVTTDLATPEEDEKDS